MTIVTTYNFTFRSHPPLSRKPRLSIYTGDVLVTSPTVMLRTLKNGTAALGNHSLTTGHDFLGVYLHWLGVAANEACPLCDHARMDGDYLLQCTGLDEYPTDDIVSQYWEARHQMVKKPSTDVG
ncbi:reverse transcriptase [Trichonephila clavipes]|nr:reverse transcriptase [Trichonephila clavipes]